MVAYLCADFATKGVYFGRARVRRGAVTRSFGSGPVDQESARVDKIKLSVGRKHSRIVRESCALNDPTLQPVELGVEES